MGGHRVNVTEKKVFALFQGKCEVLSKNYVNAKMKNKRHFVKQKISFQVLYVTCLGGMCKDHLFAWGTF